MAEYTTSGSTTALATRYDYLPGEFAPLQIETSNGKYSVHTDHLATPKLLTDSSGQVVWRSVRAAFGETTVNDDVDDNGVAVGLNIRFPGQYFDGESGLHYNYYRDYDPSLGRYIQSDPIGLEGGLNTYAYVNGNPILLYDPYGLWAVGDPLPQWLVDGSAGLGDGIITAFTFGSLTGQNLRNFSGVNGGINTCSSIYSNSKLAGVGIASLVGPMARLSYVRQARAIPRAAKSAQHAVSMRNSLKWAHRQPFSRALGTWHMSTYMSLVARGKSSSQIIAGAGRTNNAWTAGILGAGALFAGGRVANQAIGQTNNSGCGCP